MLTYAMCKPDGEILSVGRNDVLPSEEELALNIPEGGFIVDLTGVEEFDTMDILDIHDGYTANVKKKTLVKRK